MAAQSSARLLSSLDQEEMNVYLKIVKTVRMKVKRSGTIAALKERIKQTQGISEINQKLFFGGKLLSDAQTMVDCGVENNATLHLFANDDAVMKIFIMMPSNNRTVTLGAKANETVQNIKLMIQKREGILPNSFTLVYNGNVLDDETVLSSIGVMNNSTIHLVLSEKEVITFSVKAQGSEAVKLSVKSMFTIGDVKAIVMGMIGERLISNTSLYCKGELLDDSKTLTFYEIKEGFGLDLLPYSNISSSSNNNNNNNNIPMPKESGTQIFIKTWNGKTLTLQVGELDRVENIIKKAFEKMKKSIPRNAIVRLVYAGKSLWPGQYLASYGVHRDSTLQLVFTAKQKVQQDWMN